MADTTVGQAIALGNLARPDTTKVFTNAVMRGQEMNLRRRKIEQDEAAKQKQLQSEFAKMLDFGKGGFLPIYQEQATNLTSSALAEMYKKQQEGDIIGASAIRQDAKRRLEDLYAENEQFKAWQGTARQGGLITPDVLEITNMPFSQAKQKYDKLVAEKPETKEILMFDEQNRRFVPRPIKEIDYNSILNSTTSNLLANSSTPVYSKRGDLIRYDYNVSDEAIASRGNELAANEDLRVNIILRRPKDVKSEFDNIVAQQKIDVNVPEQRELAKIQAVSNVIQKDIKANADKTRFMNAPKRDGDGYEEPIKYEGKEDNGAIQIKREKITGYEFEKVGDDYKADYTKPIKELETVTVNTGNRRSLKIVKVQAAKGESYYSYERGKRMGGQVIQDVEVGNVNVLPVAKENIYVKLNDGREVLRNKKGDILSAEDEAFAKTQKGKLIYEPRFEGIATIKDITGTKKETVTIDYDEGYNAVIAGQSKDDEKKTRETINLSIKEANEKNAAQKRLEAVAKPKAKVGAATKGAPKGKKAGESFDAWKKRTKQTSYSEFLKS